MLLVDDEEGFTRITQLSLQKSGRYEVICENDPTQALDVARRFQPDVILLDMVMPDMDGATIARMLEQDEQLNDIPVALLTATIDKGEQNAEILQMADGRLCIPKPARLETLTRVIEHLTQREMAV